MSDTSTKRRRTEGRARTMHPRKGEVVQHGSATFRIDKVIDLESVLGVDVESGRAKVLAIKDLRAVPPPADSTPKEAPKALDGIPPEDWTIAKGRLDVIRPLLDLPERTRQDVEKRAAEVGRTAGTLYEWILRYTAYNDMTALIPRTRGWPKGKRRLDDDVDAIIENVIDKFYLSRERPSIPSTIAKVESKCLKAQIKCPSIATIRARINEVPERERLNARGFREKSRAKFQPTPGEFPDGNYPLQCIQIDHTEVDIQLVDDEHRKTIGRPWVTVAIDVYSRVITGCHLSLDRPSETSVALCVSQSILPKDELLLVRQVNGKWPVWGFPDKIHADNAGEFRTDNFWQACTSHGIDTEFRPVKRPQYGAHIERLIGTFMTEVHNLPGSTGSSPADKGDLDPEKRAALTFSEFEDWLFDYLCNIYHCRKHRRIGIPPLAKWEEGLLHGSGDQPPTGLPPRPENGSEILRDFLPRFERGVRRSGVEIDTVLYYGEELAPWINAPDPENPRRKLKLIFRRDPRDIRKIWFHDPQADMYFEVPTADRRFPHANVWQLREAKRDLKERGEKLIDQEQLIKTLDRLKGKVEAAAKRTKKARRQQQRHKEHERKMAAEAAESAARTGREPAATVDALDDLPDEQPESFGTW